MFFKNYEKLKPYQVEGANFALSNFYTGNRDKPGMGKTAQALLAICRYLEKNPNGKILVIVPSSLRLNWGDEISLWTSLVFNYFDHKRDNSAYIIGSDIAVVTHYQIRKYSGKINLDMYDFIVIDEFHRFKNPKAQMTKALVATVLFQQPKYLLQLSGTPIKKKIQDLFVSLYIMAQGKKTTPKITEKYKSYFLFCYRFTNVIKTPFGTLFKGVKNLEELKTYLENRFIGRDPEKVLDLPPYLNKFVTVDYKEDPELLRVYEEFNSSVKSAEISIKANSASLKAPFTVEYCDDLLEQEVGPLVIFTDHREPVKIITEGLKARGYKVAVIMGGVDTDKRKVIVDTFQAGELDAIVCTYGAASEGITLTKSCHLIINDYNWVPETVVQARGRIRRINQRNRCVYHIMGGAVVDKKIHQSLTDAIRVIEKVWRQ